MRREAIPRGASRPQADLVWERDLLAEHRVVAGMDEVGRGALAGPVSVGVVVVGPGCRDAPCGLTDSKLLTAPARRAMAPQVRLWAACSAIGHASALEIDALGIVAALRLAGRRAMAVVEADVGPISVVILDGKHDWLSLPPSDLFAESETAHVVSGATQASASTPRVLTRVKADVTCASVAGASVIAKCERDALMTELAREHPEYGWERNKGYGSPAHLAALHRHGVTSQHRRTWRLPA